MRQMCEIVRDQKPLTLPSGASVKHACQCMRERGVGAVLVTDREQKLIGIFTGRDAVRRVLAEGKDATHTRLRDVMTSCPQTLAPGCSAIEALRMMQDGRYRHVPIVEDDKIVGIVSSGDFRGLERDRLDEETGLWERI
ncbi:MAG TPA: CBS domain-containing protein [Stellaceae bacterium]|nr:CBS domain-containing protein [Stellaceae bacterium]